MKRLAFFLLFSSSITFAAGTITIFQNPGGSVGQQITSYGAGGCTGVAIDSQTSAGGTGGASPLTWNMTIGSGANRFLSVGCATSSADQVTGITVGGNSMTLSTSNYDGSSRHTYIYTYIAPPTGSQSIAASFSISNDNRVLCGAVSFTGVNQITPVDIATGTLNQPAGGTQTVTFTTTVSNDYLFDVLSNDTGSGNATPAAGQVQQWQFHDVSEGKSIAGSTKLVGTAGAYSMSWTSVSATSLQTAIAIAPCSQ